MILLVAVISIATLTLRRHNDTMRRDIVTSHRSNAATEPQVQER